MSPPNTGATGAQIAHDRIDRFRPLGAFGKPVYQSHVQLRAMLRGKRGDRAANYFAKPTYDPEVGELRWTAEVPGAARGWHEMSEAEQADKALELEVVHAQLQSYVRELREQTGGDPGGAASFASLLEQALRVPQRGDFLYFVGDQPVIAFWGFEDHDGASRDPAAQAPRYAAAAAPAAPAAAAAPVAAAVTADPGPRRRPWWWWVLALLALLLLLALLAWLLRGCGPDAQRGVDGAPLTPELPASQASAPDAAAPPLPASGASWPGVAGPGGVVPGGVGPGDTGPGVGPDAAASMPDVAPVPDGLASGPALPDAAPAPDAASAPPDATPPPVDPAASLPGTPPPGASAPGGPVPPATAPPPLPPLGEDRSMKLPATPSAKDPLGFLEGDWRAGDGLVDKQTQQPLDLSLNFRKDGQGELTLRRPDGTTCSGPVQGRMSGGRLSVEGSQAVPCSGGGSYGAPKIECEKDRGGQTQCYGINPDGSKYYMGMQRR